MEDRERVKAQIRAAFDATPRPGNAQLRGSSEGEEPFLLEDEYRDKSDWRSLSAAFVDQSPAGFGSALSFFSRDGFRYFLPAFLLADLDEQLRQSDPSFHLWHGLDDETRREKVNPRRYGDWTWFEAISERCAVFSPGEVSAIVAYLRYIAARDEFSGAKIRQALNNYWLPRLQRP